MPSESSLRSWFLVRIAQISYVFTILALNLFGKFMALRIPHVSIYPYIFLSHTVHDREIYGICKGYVRDMYASLHPRGLFH